MSVVLAHNARRRALCCWVVMTWMMASLFSPLAGADNFLAHAQTDVPASPQASVAGSTGTAVSLKLSSDLSEQQDPDKAKVDTPIAASDPAAEGDLATSSRPGQAVVPSLPALFALALQNDSDLRSQRLQAEARGEDLPKAWSGLLPSLDFTYAYSYNDSDNIYTQGGLRTCANNPETGEPLGGDDYERRCEGSTTDNVRQLQLSQPLFSMERWRQVEKAGAQARAAELQVAVKERDLALTTAEAFMNAFFASQRTRLLKGKRESLDLQVTQAQRSYDLGIGDKVDLLAARAKYDQAGADIAAAGNDFSNALSTLERLTGMSPDFSRFSLNVLTDTSLPEEPGLDNLEANIQDNADVRLAHQQLKVAQADHEVRRAGYYPEVSLNLSWSDRNSDDPYRASEDKRAAVQASMNLFKGGYTRADVRQGDLLQQSAQEDVNNAQKKALEELRKRHRNLSGDLTQLAALQHSIRSSALYLVAANKGAALGLKDLVDVLDARSDLYDQRIQYVDTFRQLVLDRLNMQAAVGQLSTRDMVDAMTLIGTIVGPVRPESGADSRLEKRLSRLDRSRWQAEGNRGQRQVSR